MIDLHLHTTASDGRSAPEDLVSEAVAAGVTTLAVTDHDTTAAWPIVLEASRAAGVACVPGIEITAVDSRRDVHVLGYFLDPADAELSAFLVRQRAERRRRVFEIADVLDRLGAPVDRAALDQRAAQGGGRALGRPVLAEALVRAGHAESIADAFDKFLGEGRPAFVPRDGAPPADVIAIIARAGGLASLAHPGKLRGGDDLLPALVAAGLPAIEVYHSDHDQVHVGLFSQRARTYGLLVTGGSDYHGIGSGRTAGLGRVGLPEADYRRLVERAGWTPPS